MICTLAVVSGVALGIMLALSVVVVASFLTMSRM